MNTRIRTDDHEERSLVQRRLPFLMLAALLAWVLCTTWLVSAGPAVSVANQSNQLSAFPKYSQRWRFGVSVARERGQINEYNVSQLCIGWYHDWGTLLTPPRPDGIEYIQHIRVGRQHLDLDHPETYNWNSLDAKIRANPGSVWVIGNEPDGRAVNACDSRTPGEYARIYKLFYDHIKGIDPSAQVANGPIIQGTPVRIDWLDKAWHEYQRLYGTEMPVDVWTMHNQIVPEAAGQFGADIPEGCDPALGRSWYTIQDNDNLSLFIEHIVRMRQWMKEHGQQIKPLILSEYGVLFSEYDGFTRDRINDYMTASFNYLLHATDVNLGMPEDGYRLVQRWAWFSLNAPLGQGGAEGHWNGNLFDPATREITENGRNYVREACRVGQPTPTPSTTPRPPLVRREAEHGSLHGTMQRFTLSSASDCRYVSLSDDPFTGVDPDMTFNVFLPVTDDYVIWARVWGVETYNGSLFAQVKVDDWPWITWDIGSTSGWQWKQISSREPLPVGSYPMVWYGLAGNGWHTIRITPRLGLAYFDAFIITSDRGYNPNTDAGAVQVCNPSPTPTATRTPMPPGPGRVSGTVALQGRGTPPAGSWASSLTISVHLPQDPIPAYQFNANSDRYGHFELPSGIMPGIYDVGVRNLHSLRNLKPGVTVTDSTAPLNMGTLVEGDANGDNRINILDFVLLASAFGSRVGQPNYDARVDMNDDGGVTLSDFVLLAGNYGMQGDRIQTSLSAQSITPLHLSNVTIYVQPNPASALVGTDFSVEVWCRVEAGEEVTGVVGVDLRMSFDPTYLGVNSLTPSSALNAIMANQVDNTAGTIYYAAGRLESPPNPVMGEFLLFTLNLHAKSVTVSTPLAFTEATAVGLNSLQHVVTPVNGTVRISDVSPTPSLTPEPTPTATLTPSITRTPSITPIMTDVPDPSRTPTRNPGLTEIILRQGKDGYTGFEDTYISTYFDWERERNFCAEHDLWLGSPNVRRILFRADLQNLPGGVTIPPHMVIEYAVLTLFQNGGSENSLDAVVYPISRSVEFCFANWVSATHTTRWGIEGCDQPNSDRGADFVFDREIFPTWQQGGFYPFDFDITSLVQMWVSNPQSNRGLLIGTIGSVASGFSFASSDHPWEEIRPLLLIRFRSGPTSTPTATHTPTATPTPTTTSTPSITPTSVARGSIRGVTFENRNANQVRDPGEPGVTGVTVELYRTTGELVGRATSRSDGSYIFSEIDPGDYHLRLGTLPAGYRPGGPGPWPVQVFAGYSSTVDIPLVREFGGYLPIWLRNRP